MNNSQDLEKVIVRMSLEIQRLQHQLEHFKMGCNHYKKRSEKLSERLKNNRNDFHKKKIQVVTSKEKRTY